MGQLICDTEMPDRYKATEPYKITSPAIMQGTYVITESGQLLIRDPVSGEDVLSEYSGILSFYQLEVCGPRVSFPHQYKVQVENGQVTGVAVHDPGLLMLVNKHELDK